MLLLFVAGIGGGLAGSIAGLASLTTYPALLAAGLPPVTANVTNTVALVANSIGSVTGSRVELTGQRSRIVRLGLVGVAGGIAGGALLLATPSGSFERIVPWLIVLGSGSILVQRRPAAATAESPHVDSRLLPIGTFVIGVYGGYFGAGAGVLLLALLLASVPEPFPRCNGLKNVILGGANAVAAALFVVIGHIDWAAAAPLAAGLFIGGRIGPVVVRHSPARLLRRLIAVAGVGLAIYLALDAYR